MHNFNAGRTLAAVQHLNASEQQCRGIIALLQFTGLSDNVTAVRYGGVQNSRRVVKSASHCSVDYAEKTAMRHSTPLVFCISCVVHKKCRTQVVCCASLLFSLHSLCCS